VRNLKSESKTIAEFSETCSLGGINGAYIYVEMRDEMPDYRWMLVADGAVLGKCKTLFHKLGRT